MPPNYSHTPTSTVGDIQLVDFSDFRFRASSMKFLLQAFINDYKAPALTEAQTKDFDYLAGKDKLTDLQTIKLQGFVDKIAAKKNPVFDIEPGAKTELHKIWNDTVKIRPILTSPAVIRGIEQEDDSIDLINLVFESKMVKNTVRFTSKYFSGELDLLTEKSILDVKTCKSWDTLTKQTVESCTVDYYWQLWTYHQLTKKDDVYIVKTLPNYTDEFIAEKQKYARNQEEIDQIYFNHNFDRFPKTKLVRVFKIQLNDEPMEIIEQLLDKYREYLNNLNTWYLNMSPKVNF